jgi:DNA-binding transcriptional LysR family regulator
MRRINFDLQHLQAFVAVAERGSFRAGAEHIHLSAPAISRRIDKLEGILGAKLFIRTTRKVELTPLGRIFLERATAAMDDLEAAILGISDLAASRTGLVTVACVPSAAIHFLPAVVQTFAERFPQIRVRVVDEAAGEVLSSVLTGESDFGIGFIGGRTAGLDFSPLRKDPFVLAMPRAHELAARKTVAWKELGGQRLIGVGRSSGNRQLLDDALTKAGVAPGYRFEVNHVATLLGMVEAGLGLAAVPQMALPRQHPTLVGLRLRGPSIWRELGLVTRRGTTLRPAAEVLRDHLRAAFQSRR